MRNLFLCLVFAGCATLPESQRPHLEKQVSHQIRQNGKWEHLSRARMQINKNEYVYCENTQILAQGGQERMVSWEGGPNAAQMFSRDALMKVYKTEKPLSNDEKCVIRKCASTCKLLGSAGLNSDIRH